MLSFAIIASVYNQEVEEYHHRYAMNDPDVISTILEEDVDAYHSLSSLVSHINWLIF